MRFAWSSPALAVCLLVLTCVSGHGADKHPGQQEGDLKLANFKFESGETLPELRLHYTTIGTPHRTHGKIDNAVLLLHGTSGAGVNFLKAPFNEVFGEGEPLDARKYYIIMPDSIGTGESSKPSDGLHMKFPHFDYDDMVRAQHELITKGLHIHRLRLILGTSMGCMHAFVWATTYPDAMDAVMPMSCEAVPIAGRNRVFRKILMETIRQDPDWMDGEYKEQPKAAVRTLSYITTIVMDTAIQMQKMFPTPEDADAAVEAAPARMAAGFDANNYLYAVDASRNYDPSSKLDDIKAHVMWVNAADDFSDPYELGLSDDAVKQIKHGRLVILAPNEQSHGHTSYRYPALWKSYLIDLLNETKPSGR